MLPQAALQALQVERQLESVWGWARKSSETPSSHQPKAAWERSNACALR